jgi:hypothetical protein
MGYCADAACDVGEDSHDHPITPEDRFNLAMAHQ